MRRSHKDGTGGPRGPAVPQSRPFSGVVSFALCLSPDSRRRVSRGRGGSFTCVLSGVDSPGRAESPGARLCLGGEGPSSAGRGAGSRRHGGRGAGLQQKGGAFCTEGARPRPRVTVEAVHRWLPIEGARGRRKERVCRPPARSAADLRWSWRCCRGASAPEAPARGAAAPPRSTQEGAVEPLGEVHLVAISKLPVTVPLRPARGLPVSSAQMAPSSQLSTSVHSCHPRSRPPLLTRPAPSSSLGRGFSPEDAAHPRPEDHSPPVLACLRARSPLPPPHVAGGPSAPPLPLADVPALASPLFLWFSTPGSPKCFVTSLRIFQRGHVRRSIPEKGFFCNLNITADFHIENDKTVRVEKYLGNCKMSRIKISIPFVPNKCELLSNLKLCYYDSGLKIKSPGRRNGG